MGEAVETGSNFRFRGFSEAHRGQARTGDSSHFRKSAVAHINTSVLSAIHRCLSTLSWENGALGGPHHAAAIDVGPRAILGRRPQLRSLAAASRARAP